MRLTKIELVTLISIVAPYILILFFFRHTDIFTFFGLLGFNALFIAGSLTILLLTKQTKFKKIYYFITTAISVTIFLSCKNGFINASDQIFFSIHKSKMSETVAII